MDPRGNRGGRRGRDPPYARGRGDANGGRHEEGGRGDAGGQSNRGGHIQPHGNVGPPNEEESKRPGKKWDGPIFGFKRLHALLDSNVNDVIMALDKNGADWEKLLESEEICKPHSDDFLVLIIHIVGEKVCHKDCNIPMQQNSVLSKSLGRNFVDKIRDKSNRIFMGVEYHCNRRGRQANPLEVDQSPNRILKSIFSFYEFIARKMPNTAVDKLLLSIPAALQAAQTCDRENLGDLLSPKFLELVELYKQLGESKKSEAVTTERRRRFGFMDEEENEMHSVEAPNDFKEIVITPTIEEILSMEKPFLRTNKREGAYLSSNHYLDVQFRLLREDFVQPLQKGIQDLVKNRHDYLTKKKRIPMGNVRVYQDVQINRAELVRDAFVYDVQLPESFYKKVRWEKSKRLLVGSLLVFTSDNFQTAYFATVAVRNDNKIKKGIFGIKWESPNKPTWGQSQLFLMVECEVYFEAYRYTLQILQGLDLTEFPMYKFIVESSSDVKEPAYLRDTPEQLRLIGRDGESIYLPPLVEAHWTFLAQANELGLDEKQFEAFKAAITKEFAIIQGPPGTGKTFLGLKIAEVFLNNIGMWKSKDSGPILVVCYTNHALDQFLQGVMDIYEKHKTRPKIIRVGGRCKSEVLEACTLHNQRKRYQSLLPKSYFGTKSAAFHEVRRLQNDRSELMTELMGLNDLKGIVSFEELSVWKILGFEYPSQMWNCLKDLKWFGVTEELFSNKKFSEDGILNQWFTLKPSKTDINPVTVFQRTHTNRVNADDDFDTDEDYDLEELMEGRIVDDIYAEAESTAPKNVGNFLQYHHLFSVQYMKNQIQAVQEQIHVIEKTEKIPNTRKTKINNCNEEIEVLKRKQSFIEKLFSTYSQGLIQFGKTAEEIDAIVKGGRNLYVLPRADKWEIFFHIVNRSKALVAQKVTEIEVSLIHEEKKYKEILTYGDGILLQNTQVVGMTTTGAAKYNDLLKIMKSRIVIVEEAAEVLESHIVTCITQHCQHLILIGDHRQLRPSTTVYNLAKQYYLDLSLFERMINNNLNWYQLKMQHRMRPEIANLVVGTIYSELDNHESVTLYPPVGGIVKNLFFVSHRELEKAESDSLSKSNVHEATFLSLLCRHIILQGYSAERVTILTTYTGQMFLLKQEIGKIQTCRGVKITCVDNFQGEENDIILLSLVRSNDQNKIGFLNIDNRVCVAISRAKHGLYICGNMTSLSSNSETWRKIEQKLLERDEIGDKMELCCQIHGVITRVGNASDFNAVLEGGCQLDCDTNLMCGHKCRLTCHIVDREHKEYQCKKRCEKTCSNQHRCASLCYQTCKPCTVLLTKTLPCGHDKTLACHVAVESVECMENVLKTLPCGHKETMACHRSPAAIKCNVVVPKQLKCLHVKEEKCHIDADEITCRVNVNKTLPCGHEEKAPCFTHADVIRCKTVIDKVFDGCGHKIQIKCNERDHPRKCKTVCKTRLNCGHACTLICHVDQDPQHIMYICKKTCGRQCPDGHRCKKNHMCNKPCEPCTEKVKRTLPCNHETQLECYADVKNHNCLHPCDRTFSPCGHRCQNLCFQPCGSCMVLVKQTSIDCRHIQDIPCSEFASKRRCEERVRPARSSSCVHDTLVPCRIADTITPDEATKYCEFPCGMRFEEKDGGCGHRCKGSCSQCEQGRLHLKCQQDCRKPLVCGHVCTFPCSESCPPCERPCTLKCEHSECGRICGEPCMDCNERCTWRCPHRGCSKLCRERCDVAPCEEPCPKKLKCSHPCVGFCGDPCPPLCLQCDYAELTELLFGFEEDDDARFVYLEDCKHTIESQGMDKWMQDEGENGEISAKLCPKCKTMIRSTKRYGNIIRQQLENIMKVKVKVFGNEKLVKEKLELWVQKLRWDENWKRYFPVLRDYLISHWANIVPTGATFSPKNEKEHVVPKKVGESSMASLELIARHGEDAIKVLQKSADLNLELMDEVRKHYKDLFEKLMKRKIPLSNVEARDFDKEFDRIYDLQQLYRIRSSAGFTNGHSRATPVYEKARRKLLSLGTYSRKIKESVYTSFKELEDILKTGLGISERERQEILNAFNMRQGRWFKCPNGHIYLITECGGAMIESVCNECGARIGGGSHRLRTDNALASEMDGATAPLWPNMV